MRAARAALCLLLLAAGAASARADAFSDADETFTRIEARLSHIEAPRLAGRYASEADCLARFDLDALVRDATSSAMIDDLSRQMDPVVQFSFRYYTCEAAARRDDGVCAPLTAFDDYARPHPHLECSRYSKELIFIRALMTGAGNLRPLCRADLTHPEDVEFRPEDFDAVCSLMISDYRHPAEVCGRLTPYFVKPAQFDRCKAWFSSFAGDETGCRTLGDNDVRERCFAYSYFHKARETGNIKDCRGAGICEMFMTGDAASCAYYSRKIAAHLCPFQPARNARLAKERAELGAELARAEDRFKSLPPGLRADLVRKRLQGLRRRFEGRR